MSALRAWIDERERRRERLGEAGSPDRQLRAAQGVPDQAGHGEPLGRPFLGVSGLPEDEALMTDPAAFMVKGTEFSSTGFKVARDRSGSRFNSCTPGAARGMGDAQRRLAQRSELPPHDQTRSVLRRE